MLRTPLGRGLRRIDSRHLGARSGWGIGCRGDQLHYDIVLWAKRREEGRVHDHFPLLPKSKTANSEAAAMATPDAFLLSKKGSMAEHRGAAWPESRTRPRAP